MPSASTEPSSPIETPKRSGSYPDRLRWDTVTWGSHCVDCYPGNCPYRVYVRDGKVVREEVAGTLEQTIPDTPDRNPMGCQKGAGWSQTLYGPERLRFPLKRKGERGSGEWERISWDQSLEEIADALIDAIQEGGPESIVHENTPAEGGATAQWPCGRLIADLLGGLRTDVNGVINDFQQGQYLTWGKFNPSTSPESHFLTEVDLIWHANPTYTQIPLGHFATEARYRGAETFLIAPDVSPSHIHTDYFIPVRIGTDAALALSMCQVIVGEGLHAQGFIKEQTDLALLVRRDTGRFLRESDLRDGGADDQLHWLDSRSGGPVPAPLATLDAGDVVPALEGSAVVTLQDGQQVETVPAFVLLRENLAAYEPEAASKVCGVAPSVIRMLAHKIATKKTAINRGMNLCKYYHGDLMERSMLLLLALTANWGQVGTGMGSWTPGNFEGPAIFSGKQRPGIQEAERFLQARDSLRESVKAENATWTDEMAAIEWVVRMTRGGFARHIPTVFLYYYHYGYRFNWNQPGWGDPGMKRTFDEYITEALDKGWWQGVVKPGPETPPRVLIEVGGNILRRQRGGQNMLVRNLWPKLTTIVQVDWRMNTTGMFSDYVLPAAQHYEKLSFHFATPSLLKLTFSDRAAAPIDEAKPEWEIFGLLARKIEERAKARGFLEYTDGTGRVVRLDNLHHQFTLGLDSEDLLVDEWMRDTALTGTLEQGATLETMRERGYARIEEMGSGSAYTLNQASDVEPGVPFVALRWHTEKKLPYPTFTRRAQFYIDHDWFLEAGEQLPVHKENPKMGGDYPCELTSGHNRWSIHSMNITNQLMLDTHRGRPHMVVNDRDAAARGVADDEQVRVFNDLGSFLVPVKTSGSVRPGQVIVYNGWDPYQFEGWKGPMDIEPGMVKWLHLAGGYGHLRYWPIQWQPTPVDRAVRVEWEKVRSRATPGA